MKNKYEIEVETSSIFETPADVLLACERIQNEPKLLSRIDKKVKKLINGKTKMKL